ncbi:putative G-protein coupled receptor 173 [Tubulanus polymorphus]|uniref:putative G-protein coupled receptor 173 n=1 Tax=Tubulanus polymorphus TaxID=672921 RepID=UPI003DA363D9
MDHYGKTRDDVIIDQPSQPTTVEDNAVAIVIKLTSLLVIILISVAGNTWIIFIIVRNIKFRRLPYYYAINLAIADSMRAVFCLPVSMATIMEGSTWKYGVIGCRLFASVNVLFTFCCIYTLFALSVDRYTCNIYHRYYTRTMTSPIASSISITVIWCSAFFTALPPIFGVGTYSYIPLEAQCTLEYRYYRNNDTLGFMLISVITLGTILTVYSRVFVFMRAHRRMRPVLYTPASSRDWTFFGPGATGQALANWMNGFASGPPHPAVLGLRSQSNLSSRLHSLNKHHQGERLTRLFLVITLCYVVLWTPYVIMQFWNMFDIQRLTPPILVTCSTWLTYIQLMCNPVIHVLLNSAFRQVALPFRRRRHRRRQNQRYILEKTIRD